MSTGFPYAKSLSGTTDKLQRRQLANSATFSRFMACKTNSAGKIAPVSSQTDQATHVFQDNGITTLSNDIEKAFLREISRDDVFSVGFIPLLNGVAISAGSSTSATAPMSAGSANDLVGGYIYFPRYGEKRLITSNGYSGGNVVIGWAEPLGAPDPQTPVYPNTGDPSGNYTAITPAVGDLISVVAFGPGTTGLKYDSSALGMGISNAQSDTTGGTIVVESVDMVFNIAKVRLKA